MKISKDLKTLTTTQTELGRALGISQVRVSQLTTDGVMTKAPDGSMLVIESVKNYYKMKSAAEAVDDVDLNEERAKHEKAKREIAELRLAKMKREAYDARTVELVMTEMTANLRTQLMGLPAKLAPVLDGKSKEEIYTAMTREIEEKLSELAEYDPAMFAEELEEADDEDGA